MTANSQPVSQHLLDLFVKSTTLIRNKSTSATPPNPNDNPFLNGQAFDPSYKVPSPSAIQSIPLSTNTTTIPLNTRGRGSNIRGRGIYNNRGRGRGRGTSILNFAQSVPGFQYNPYQLPSHPLFIDPNAIYHTQQIPTSVPIQPQPIQYSVPMQPSVVYVPSSTTNPSKVHTSQMRGMPSYLPKPEYTFDSIKLINQRKKIQEQQKQQQIQMDNKLNQMKIELQRTKNENIDLLLKQKAIIKENELKNIQLRQLASHSTLQNQELLNEKRNKVQLTQTIHDQQQKIQHMSGQSLHLEQMLHTKNYELEKMKEKSMEIKIHHQQQIIDQLQIQQMIEQPKNQQTIHATLELKKPSVMVSVNSRPLPPKQDPDIQQNIHHHQQSDERPRPRPRSDPMHHQIQNTQQIIHHQQRDERPRPRPRPEPMHHRIQSQNTYKYEVEGYSNINHFHSNRINQNIHRSKIQRFINNDTSKSTPHILLTNMTQNEKQSIILTHANIPKLCIHSITSHPHIYKNLVDEILQCGQHADDYNIQSLHTEVREILMGNYTYVEIHEQLINDEFGGILYDILVNIYMRLKQHKPEPPPAIASDPFISAVPDMSEMKIREIQNRRERNRKTVDIANNPFLNQNRRIAYATAIDPQNSTSFISAMVFAYSLKKSGNKYPLILLISNLYQRSSVNQNNAISDDVLYKRYFDDVIYVEHNLRDDYSWIIIHIFKLCKYEKVMFFQPLSLVMQNIDGYVSGCSLLPMTDMVSYDPLLNAMLIQPSMEHYKVLCNKTYGGKNDGMSIFDVMAEFNFNSLNSGNFRNFVKIVNGAVLKAYGNMSGNEKCLALDLKSVGVLCYCEQNPWELNDGFCDQPLIRIWFEMCLVLFSIDSDLHSAIAVVTGFPFKSVFDFGTLQRCTPMDIYQQLVVNGRGRGQSSVVDDEDGSDDSDLQVMMKTNVVTVGQREKKIVGENRNIRGKLMRVPPEPDSDSSGSESDAD